MSSISLSAAEALPVKARSYQLEMFDLAMKKGNAIVVMDTGSGKTHVALLRIMHELQHGDPSKRTWFLAPTVPLCKQQADAIRTAVPAARLKLLLGEDNVHRWSRQSIWDTVLRGIQVVVSTHQVLLDALTHAFVRMSGLSLLVFDEAHHCSGNHASNKIMRDFYHPEKSRLGPGQVPSILGMTASPVTRSKVGELEKIESNLDAMSISPRIHREDLLRFVHPPELLKLEYDEAADEASRGIDVLKSMEQVLSQILSAAGGASRRVSWAGEVRQQISHFRDKASHIHKELGPWAADYFITESVLALRRASESGRMAFSARQDVKERLLRTLDDERLDRVRASLQAEATPRVSPKVSQLLRFLDAQDSSTSAGIIFVEQRATVGALHALLCAHPAVRDRYSSATFVGESSSNYTKRLVVSELFDLKTQAETLGHFRSREKNLVVATNVLEEGIDISACNLVVCFAQPQNLKAFIQRRGRARKDRSQFAALVPRNDPMAKIDRWKRLEDELVKMYTDETRQRLEAEELEATEEEMGHLRLQVESTGALLTADGAIAHLQHFCSLLPRDPFVDNQPDFSISVNPTSGLLTATVTLPLSVCPELRCHASGSAWRSERSARKDAAFQAYRALFLADLINDNLLPRTHDWALGLVEGPEGHIDIAPQLSMWDLVAEAWSRPDLHATEVTFETTSDGGAQRELLAVSFITPCRLPAIVPVTLHWDANTTYVARFGHSKSVVFSSDRTLDRLRRVTRLLHRSHRSAQMADPGTDYLAVFNIGLAEHELEAWLEKNEQRHRAEDFFRDGNPGVAGFIRDRQGKPCFFHDYTTCEGDDGAEQMVIECHRLPRRRDLLSQSPPDFIAPGGAGHRPSIESLPVELCTVDSLPVEVACLGIPLASLLHHVHSSLLADHLSKTMLREVGFRDCRHIVTAITAPAAAAGASYQRYEFIGDGILKFIAATQLFAENKNWHEGYLSQRRDNLVCNKNLSREAISKGLDRFVITEKFTARKYRPLHVSQALDRAKERRTVSAKLLADVTEALIGAAFKDSGMAAARQCAHTFLPLIRPAPPQFEIPEGECNGFDEVEGLIDYEFRHKSLLVTALTHPSYANVQYESYQRLEFLGDAVLDALVTTLLAKHKPELSEGLMTQIKAALVNANLLGFACYNFVLEREVVDKMEEVNGRFTERKSIQQIPLSDFMLHNAPQIAESSQAFREHNQLLGPKILDALENGNSYPWLLLADLKPRKFHSDIVESILGAVFVDSGGDLDRCMRLLERIGLTVIAGRAMSGELSVQHPLSVLASLCGSSSIEFDVREKQEPFACVVKIDGEDMGQAEGCLTKDDARLAAASKAIEKLESI